MTTDEIRAELEDLRREGNNPRVTLWQMRRIYRRRRELFAQLELAELETTKGTNDDDIAAAETRLVALKTFESQLSQLSPDFIDQVKQRYNLS